MRIPLIMSLLVLPMSALLAQAQTQTSKSNEYLTPQQKENLRLCKIMEWAEKAKPSQKELQNKIYEPVVMGNRKDYPNNLKAVDFFNAKSEEAAKKNQDKMAQKYNDLASAYQKLAQQNVAIVKAIQDCASDNLSKAFAEVAKQERAISELSGKNPVRDWFMPSDFQRTSPQSSKTAAPPAAPAQTPLK